MKHPRAMTDYELSLATADARKAGADATALEEEALRRLNEQHGARTKAMSTDALIGWSLGLALPVHFLFYLILAIDVTSGSFLCRGFHNGGIVTCSVGNMLSNVVNTVVLLNVLSYGLLFIATACGLALILFCARAARRALRAHTASHETRQA